jgi:hypothetical protein
MDLYPVRRTALPKGSHKGRQMAHHQSRGKYAKQRIRTTQNKMVSQQKHLSLHPNDLQAVENIRKSRDARD